MSVELRPARPTGRTDSAPRRAWYPILDGRLAGPAADALTAIRSGLAAWLGQPGAAGRADDATLAGGTAGAALFFDYLARAGGDQADRQFASRLLREAADRLTTGTSGLGLHEGLAGVIWTATHLRGTELDLATEVSLARIDATMLAYLSRSPWHDQFDLISGLVGLGVYALERLPRPAARGCLEQVVARLDELAERGPAGVTWKTPPALLPDFQRGRFPTGWYNLGVAHGVPGIVGLLAGACAVGVAADRARPLLHGAVDWLLAQQLPATSEARFPHCIAPELDPAPSRLAWCFGDAGIAATLLLAARGEEIPAWEQAALTIARRAATRRFESSGVEDAGLCHGAAGLAQIFTRLYQATGEPWLADAARAWFERTLTLAAPTLGSAAEPPADPSFLTGTAGVGLALLAGRTTVAPAWDRVLLLSVA